MIKYLILKNRSYRRFHQDVLVSSNTLEELIYLARHLVFVANLKSLKHILS